MNYLIEFENIEQFEELFVFLIFLQLDVVLLQAVESQLGFIVDINFHRLSLVNITHEMEDVRKGETEKGSVTISATFVNAFIGG